MADFFDLTVTGSRTISPSMHQVTIGGADLERFPVRQDGGYFKLILEEGGRLKKPLMRTYTIRNQRARELDVWFALHGGNAAGPATSWALNAKIGDPITIRGPGAPKPFKPGFDYYLVAGDMSALPAISANLEGADRRLRGYAALEIQDEDDRIEVDAPPGFEIEWIVNPAPGTASDLLAKAVRKHIPTEGSIAGWAAAEFSAMRQLRQLLRDEMALGSDRLYISSYWKHGLNETEHKVAKREDAEAQPA